ncbi:Clp protease N-terminal domain-containing protein [Asanoa iriomotensis]|uniref:Clp R domain-containing protein n=1 Tax=Asanoa iriomotensis TaxID=234613 RepID=A0ABQ4CAA0_9ACTN|nr:Clp protease N-terminal domain-containing protein [Asanoa iriomotensis]GIF59706.1 hypothetical protein Air01nite_58010 [Asanoa iriomotensis]
MSVAPQPPEPSAETLAEQVRRMRPGGPFLGDELLAAKERSEEISLHRRHRPTGTTHYLLALLEAPTTAPLLDACGVDSAALRASTEELLSQMPTAWR